MSLLQRVCFIIVLLALTVPWPGQQTEAPFAGLPAWCVYSLVVTLGMGAIAGGFEIFRTGRIL